VEESTIQMQARESEAVSYLAFTADKIYMKRAAVILFHPSHTQRYCA